MSEAVSQEGKTRAIIAHITLVGWIIAVVMNNNETKNDYASFYIRQMLGIIIVSIGLSTIGMFIPVIGAFMPLLAVALWVMSLISATQDKKEPLPVIGDMFQDWFKAL